jgi:hypothetical protein
MLGGISLATLAQVDDAVRDLYLYDPSVLLNAFDDRFDAYYGFDLPGSSFTMKIESQRETGSQEAVIRLTYKFPRFSALVRTRIEFLEPQELEGDVYIIIAGDRTKDVFFWNDSLIEPIKLDGRFALFGDVNVFEVIGYRVSDADYLIDHIALSDILIEETGLNGDRVVEYDLRTRPERAESALFPNVKIIAAGNLPTTPYAIQLFDDSGDLLHTIRYSDYRINENRAYSERHVVTARYAAIQVVENHLVPGNTTTMTINDDIVIDAFPDEMFDPSLLGQR